MRDLKEAVRRRQLTREGRRRMPWRRDTGREAYGAGEPGRPDRPGRHPRAIAATLAGARTGPTAPPERGHRFVESW